MNTPHLQAALDAVDAGDREALRLLLKADPSLVTNPPDQTQWSVRSMGEATGLRYASWLNQVEIWFGIITRLAVRRGSFRKVSELVARIERFTAQWNANAQPFAWTATADSILAKVKRLCYRITTT